MSWPRAVMRTSNWPSRSRRCSSCRPTRARWLMSGARTIRRVTAVASVNSGSVLRVGGQVEPQVQLPQPARVDGRRRLHQEVLRLLVQGKGDDLANVALVGEEHDDAIDARGGAPVGR